MRQLIRNGVSSISLAARGAEVGRALEVGDAPPLPVGGVKGRVRVLGTRSGKHVCPHVGGFGGGTECNRTLALSFVTLHLFQLPPF